MTPEAFEQLVAEEFPRAIPEKFRHLIKNVAFLIENEPSTELRTLEGLKRGETLLGHYHGVPYPLRGDWYGMGATMPDMITLFQIPIEAEGRYDPEHIRQVVRETIWHEVAHHFGMDEEVVRRRENTRDDSVSTS
ncbi:MAG: metallopeptidase family protein [Patescibacteria group bacterium]